MPSQSGFFRPIATSALPVTRVGSAPLEGYATTAKAIYCVEVEACPDPAGSSVDIDDLVAEFQRQSPQGRTAMHEGRQWVAQHVYPESRLTLAQLRLQKGWSQAELAKRAATSQSYVARLEQGQIDPQVSTVRKIANALEVPLEVLAQTLLTEVRR